MYMGFRVRFPLKQESENHVNQETFSTPFPGLTFYFCERWQNLEYRAERMEKNSSVLALPPHSPLEAELLGSKGLKWVPLHGIKI